IGLDFAWDSYNHFCFATRQCSGCAPAGLGHGLNLSLGTFDNIGKRLEFSAVGSKTGCLCNAIRFDKREYRAVKLDNSDGAALDGGGSI
ncbi:MAG TPA: hypothetical protein VN754_12970, partial [Candidatus Binataceae bacterium]|nr:hypothetical protein [Candidatus Binataceae bacterium]